MFKNCQVAGVGVDSQKYHTQAAERGTPEFIMSPSSLKEFAHCPSRWRNGYKQPDSDAKDFGSLLDCILLTPEQFKTRYAVKPETYKDAKTGELKPWNGNSGVCKAWMEEHADFCKVSSYEVLEAQTATKRLMADETIAEYVNNSDKQVQLSGEWHDPATKLVIPVQCLIDLVPKEDSAFRKSLGDLKTTRNGAQSPFSRQVFTFGWHIQAAMDLDLFYEANHQDRSDWIFIGIENYPPFQTARRLLSLDFVEIGRATYKDALKRYAKCLKTGVWEGYDAPEEFSLVQPTPWMEFEAVSSHMEASQLESMADNFDITP